MKYLFNIALLLFVCSSYAQLTLTDLDTGLPIVDGDSYDFDVLATAAPNSGGKIKFRLSNSSATETIRVLGQMVSFTNTDGSNCQFCVNPECYFAVAPGDTIPSSPVVMPPGTNNGNFDSFYNSDPGDGVNYPISYTFRFFMLDDNGNEVGDDINITYNYTPANMSARSFDLNDLGIDMENTAVKDYLYLNLENPVTLKVYDLTSKLIKDINLNNGTNSVEFSSLNPGYYFAQFTDESNRSATVKILKQ